MVKNAKNMNGGGAYNNLIVPGTPDGDGADVRGKRLLILGGASVHCKLVTAAKEMGIYTIVTDYLPDSPAKKMADKSYMYDVNDIDGIAEMCKREGVYGIVGPYLDPCQRPYYKLCSRLGLPCYIDTWEQVYTLTDKIAFKAQCVKSGLDIIPTFDRSEPDKIDFPVLVKPGLSRGSRGQKVCYNLSETDEAIEKASAESGNSQAVIEKFMGGSDDFTMTLLFSDGEAVVTKTSDIYTGSIQDGLENVYIAIVSPSIHTDFYFEKIHARVVKMIKELGITNGPVFMQGFKDGDTVRFYDPGFRFPGSCYDLNLKRSCGIDIMKTIIRFALTGRMGSLDGMSEAARLNGKTAVTLTPGLRPGKIARISGIEEIEAMPGMTSVFLRHREGDEICFSKSVNQLIGAFEYISDSRNEAHLTAKKIFSVLKVEDEHGNDMLLRSDPFLKSAE